MERRTGAAAQPPGSTRAPVTRRPAPDGAGPEAPVRAPRPARPETTGRTTPQPRTERPPRSERTDRCEGADLFFGGRTPRPPRPEPAEDADRPDRPDRPAGRDGSGAGSGKARAARAPGRDAPRVAGRAAAAGDSATVEATGRTERAEDREEAGYGLPDEPAGAESDASAEPVVRQSRSGGPEAADAPDRPAGGDDPAEGYGSAEPVGRRDRSGGELEAADSAGPPAGADEQAENYGSVELVARRDRSGRPEGADTPDPPTEPDDRPVSRTEPPRGNADGPVGRSLAPAEPHDGYGALDRSDRSALPERPERIRRTGRLERPTRPVRAPRPPRPEPPQPLEPAAPSDAYERPELPGQSLPAVPEKPASGASPARTRSAQPARTAPPGGDHADSLEPAARAASLEPASRPPVVSRESTPPRRHPLAAPPQPPRREARGAEFVGERPPTYDAEPTAWPAADPQDLDGLVPDTVLDGAQYGAVTLRALSLRGDSARYRGEPRRDALLTARFGDGDGALLLVAMASGLRGTDVAPRAARDACRWLAGAVGRSHARLADDIRGGRRGELKSGLHRLTDRSYGRLRARAAELGLRPEEYTATVRCLLLTADPQCRTRVFFGVGPGGLFRLREGVWQDLEPDAPPERTGEPAAGYGSASADTMTVDLGIPTPGLTPPVEPEEPAAPGEPFRFRASVARPGDALMLCTAGLAEPMRGEPELGGRLAERWAGVRPPGLAAFLADTQLRVKGYADDRTACAIWEA
ncbi:MULTISPECIES: protein phosphatase 2C domain-containing protein [Streptomyces]|uniref:protein phosphatase 2C domain-containing protein n=1 Tax=Streptomyces TaxID=1883 RepID=UPI00345BCF4F